MLEELCRTDEQNWDRGIDFSAFGPWEWEEDYDPWDPPPWEVSDDEPPYGWTPGGTPIYEM